MDTVRDLSNMIDKMTQHYVDLCNAKQISVTSGYRPGTIQADTQHITRRLVTLRNHIKNHFAMTDKLDQATVVKINDSLGKEGLEGWNIFLAGYASFVEEQFLGYTSDLNLLTKLVNTFMMSLAQGGGNNAVCSTRPTE